MDPITQQTTLAAAGGKKDPVYVDDVFTTTLYEGNQTARTISTGIDNTDKSLVWLKSRSNTHTHYWYDTERGATYALDSTYSSTSTQRSAGLTSFLSDGFQLGTLAGENGSEMAAWNFKAEPGFFDVVTWSGTNTNRDIAHNLGSVPGMVIVKKLTGDAWYVYHRSHGATKYLELNLTGTGHTSSATWNNTTPTSSVFTVGSFLNSTGATYVAYIFAHDEPVFGTDSDESIIKCGSFANNGGQVTDVNLGFEPQLILIKNSSASESWHILDVNRDMNLQRVAKLFPNNSNAEDISGYPIVYPTATGFTVTTASAGDWVSGTYIYMAIRRPHKPPEAATDVFAMDTGNASSTIPTWDSSFPVDAAWVKQMNSSEPGFLTSRIIGERANYTDRSNAEHSDGWLLWDSNVGWGENYSSGYISHMFKRAPGFMDVVAYSGDATSNRAVPHNLKVTPELLILKRRQSEHWMVQYTGVFGTNTAVRLSTNAAASAQAAFNSTSAATASNFYVGSDSSANGSTSTYIAYLFATLPGISKVGTYSGTGSAFNVDCGFTNGARFVLIKRTDSTGNWFVLDTARGIVPGNDPLLELNTTSAQDSSYDNLDPYNQGFTVTAYGGTSPYLNISGGTYIFLAIA